MFPHPYDVQLLDAVTSHDTVAPVEDDGGGGGRPPRGKGKPSLPPPAMGQIHFETPDQWGQLVRSSPDGLSQVYELDFGGGHRVTTFVLWANPAIVGR